MNEHQDRAIHLSAVVSQGHFIGTMVRAQNNHGNKHQVTSKAVMLNAHRGTLEEAVQSLAQTTSLLSPDHLCHKAGCFRYHQQMMHDTCCPGQLPAQVITSYRSFSWIFYPFFTSGPQLLHQELLKPCPDPPQT